MSNDAQTVPADAEPEGRPEPGDNTLSPLAGEHGRPRFDLPPKSTVSKKGLLAVGLLTGGLVAISAGGIHRFASGPKSTDDRKLARSKPAAASTEPRKLEMPTASAAATGASIKVPALTPTDEEVAEPIGVRRTGSTAPAGKGPKEVLPEDAPVVLVSARPGGAQAIAASSQPGSMPTSLDQAGSAPDSQDPMAATSRNLQAYQRQLQGLLDNLSRSADLATSAGAAAAGPASPMAGFAPAAATGAAASNGLFGGQLPGSATPKVAARLLEKLSLTLPKGAAFTCALKTRVISAASGLVACQTQRDVYSADGVTVLIERGSHVDGEYRITSVKPGTVRIPVLWTRIRTPLGVVVDIESPATGPLGEGGIDGYVDNRWGERIGAAMLLSLIDDSVKLVIQSQTEDRQASTVVLPSTTSNTSKLAEKVLDSTINIPPLIYQNQGGIVGIYVARDVDFSSVYELAPTAMLPSRP